MKNIILKITAIFSVIIIFMSSVFTTSAAVPSYVGKPDFLLGINAHGTNSAAYPIETIDTQVKLAAQLGSKIYRTNLEDISSPQKIADFNKAVDTVRAYNMEVMCVFYPSGTLEQTAEIARRYKGKVSYYQVNNEVDVQVGNNKGRGDKPEHYHMDKLVAQVKQMAEAAKGIRAGDPDAKIVVNAAWWHTYFMKYCVQNMDMDIIGWDWYSDMEDASSLNLLLNEITGPNYGGKDVMICETNLWPSKYPDEETRDYARTNFIDQMCKVAYEHPSKKVKGLIIYELLDEPTLGIEDEKHFGLVNVTIDNNGKHVIGKPKYSFKGIQALWTAKDTSTIPPPATSSKASTSTASGNTSSKTISKSPSEASNLSSENSSDTDSVSLEDTSDIVSSDNSSSNSSRDKNKSKDSFPVWIIIVIAGVLVLAAGGFSTWYFIRKRKSADNDSTQDE